MVETRWSCAYEARSGGRATATFESWEQATEFATRHAQITASEGEWSTEAGGAWLLKTATGLYRVEHLTSEPALR